MPLSSQDALIQLMALAASSDELITDRELQRIETLVGRLPVFKGYDGSQVETVANAAVDALNASGDVEAVLAGVVADIPARLQDTAYALAVEITAVDLNLRQEELRFLEMLRDRLDLDRLVTAAIETAARARYRHA